MWRTGEQKEYDEGMCVHSKDKIIIKKKENRNMNKQQKMGIDKCKQPL